MQMRPETEKLFRVIMDTFSGEDGGVAFVRIRDLIEEMDQRVNDPAAEKLVKIMKDFARLIQTSQNLTKE